MSITLTALQKQRTDTAANWTSANPTLLAGELGFESDTGKAKLGTGSTAWTSLGYLGIIPSSGDYPLSQLLLPLGSQTVPSLTFTGDANTGLYSPGADQVALTTGGTARLTATTTALTAALPINYPLGAAATPSVTFTGDLNTGIYSPGADQVALATGGTARLTATTTALTSALPLDVPLGTAGAPSLTFTGDLNTGIYSPGADQLALATGGSGRLFVSSGGQIGINTANPDCVFGINDTQGGTRFHFDRNSYSNIFGGFNHLGDSGGFALYNVNSSVDRSIRFLNGSSYAGLTERMRIDSSGRVGIGTSTVSRILHVTGAADTIPRFNAPTGYYCGLELAENNSNTSGNYWQINKAPSTHSLEFYNGTNRMVLDASGNLNVDSGTFYVDAVNNRVSIGTQSPQALFHSKAGATTSAGIFESGSASGSWLSFVDTGTNSYTRVQVGSVGNELVLRTTDLERARIDSSGRLLVGTSTASKNADRLTGNKIALVGVGGYPSHVITGYGEAGIDAGPVIDLQKSRGSSDGSMTVVASGDRIGSINFLGADGTNFIRAAAINSEVDGTPGTNDMPGRLVFSTTADGASSPTERMRIANNGRITVANSALGAVTALTDAATIAVDLSLANNFSVTLGGNRTLGAPTNQTAGQSGFIVITQDGTGSRTLGYNSVWKFAAGAAPTLTTTANAVDVLAYYVESATRITTRVINDVK